jgi:UDP-2,3-diacylglucosamine pyrophosphatase LpxH
MILDQIVEDNPNADNYVFVGDYFDSYDISGIEQLINAENIVRFKKYTEKTTNQKVYLLIGNHDHHYFPGTKWRGTTSGYQSKMVLSYEHLMNMKKN